MRFLCEICVAGLLIVLGWAKPFKERFFRPEPEKPAVAASPRLTQPSAASGDWMWKTDRRTSLDRPAYQQTYGVSSAPSYYEAGSYFFPAIQTDKTGRKYWVDSDGNTHYPP